jgi:hypothetical protein
MNHINAKKSENICESIKIEILNYNSTDTCLLLDH